MSREWIKAILVNPYNTDEHIYMLLQLLFYVILFNVND